MVAGVAKSFNLTPDYVLHRISYANAVLYGAVLPSYKSSKDNKEPVIDADDPRNREAVKKELFG